MGWRGDAHTACDGAQAGVFSTFVCAVRRMALEDWPGFARGGALWFPDLRQAARAVYSPDAVPAAAGAGKAPWMPVLDLLSARLLTTRNCFGSPVPAHVHMDWRPARPHA